MKTIILRITACTLLLLSSYSCKKEAVTEKKEVYESKLPNYSHVQLDKVFTDEDRHLADRSATVAQLNHYYDVVWEQGHLSGSFLVAKGDDILIEKYKGFGRVNEQMPIDKDTPLHVASVSKTMTAMAVMKLIEAGKLSLEDDLTKFFPKFPYPNITIFSLLSQRSGLPKYEHFDQSVKPKPAELDKPFINNQDVLNILERDKPELARPSNTGFMYCNTNFALLALVVEKVTGTSFPQAMQEILFKALGMDHTFIFQEKDIPTASQSFYNGQNRLYPLDHFDLIYGDKNVYTTPRDLLKFSTAMFANDFLKPELKAKIFEPYSNEKAGINNYGLGFRMKNFDNGERLTYHNGWWHGSNAVFTHLLKSKVTIIAIGNKYSQRVYSAMALSALFEDFPFEVDKLKQVLDGKHSQSGNADSANVGSNHYSE